MAGPARIALVGDYSPDVIAHRAIPLALALARAEAKCAVEWHWVATRDIRDAAHDLADFAAVWVVPASPYENMTGALDAIRFARETQRPFLGTCGGFQHALIEFARNVVGLATADHAETASSGFRPEQARPGEHVEGPVLVVTPLSCSLVEKAGPIRFASGSLIRAAYGRDTVQEDYHCSYGLNAAHRLRLEQAGLRFTAFDDAGDPRAAELATTTHPFFVGTLFQPERAALRGETPPLVRAFVTAATQRRL